MDRFKALFRVFREYGERNCGLRETVWILAILLSICRIPQCDAAGLYPQDFGFSKRFDYLIDAGFDWESNSLFHPFTAMSFQKDTSTAFGHSSSLFHPLLWYAQGMDSASTIAGNAPWVIGQVGVEGRLRLTGSVLLDDFQLDGKDRKRNQDQLGYQVHCAWTPVAQSMILTLLGDYVRIGTFTTQHGSPYTNFVNRGVYLGHPIGNDADLAKVGLRLIPRQPVMIEVAIGQHRWGDNSLLANPYMARKGGAPHKPFPSGNVRATRFMEFEIDSQLWSNLAVDVAGVVDFTHSGEGSGVDQVTITLRYTIPFSF